MRPLSFKQAEKMGGTQQHQVDLSALAKEVVSQTGADVKKPTSSVLPSVTLVQSGHAKTSFNFY